MSDEQVGELIGTVRLLTPQVQSLVEQNIEILKEGCPRGKSNTKRINFAIAVAVSAWISFTGFLCYQVFSNLMEKKNEADSPKVTRLK